MREGTCVFPGLDMFAGHSEQSLREDVSLSLSTLPPDFLASLLHSSVLALFLV